MKLQNKSFVQKIIVNTFSSGEIYFTELPLKGIISRSHEKFSTVRGD